MVDGLWINNLNGSSILSRILCLIFTLFIATPSFALFNHRVVVPKDCPGAVQTLKMVESLNSYAVPFQKRFDDLCNSAYLQADKLDEDRRANYLFDVDLKLNRDLRENEEVSCRTGRAYFVDLNGNSGFIKDKKTHTVYLSFDKGKGEVQINYSAKRINYNYSGQKIAFKFDGDVVEKNKIIHLNVPYFAKYGFEKILRDSGKSISGSLPSNMQKIILGQVYWYVAKKKGAPSLFTFYKDLLMHPKQSSVQILALYDQYKKEKEVNRKKGSS